MKKKRPTKTKDREVDRLEDIPNIGPAVASDLRQLGINVPADLLGLDPYAIYDDLCRIAAVRYMAGEPKKPWWKYTAERKREMAARREAGG